MKITLDQSKTGDHLKILSIEDEIKNYLIRFGIQEGSDIICHEKIPLGPIIIKLNHQELAIGRGLARKILVEKLASADVSSEIKAPKRFRRRFGW